MHGVAVYKEMRGGCKYCKMSRLCSIISRCVESSDSFKLLQIFGVHLVWLRDRDENLFAKRNSISSKFPFSIAVRTYFNRQFLADFDSSSDSQEEFFRVTLMVRVKVRKNSSDSI